MRLLLDFLCRFGWGMAVGLVFTPAAIVTPGFFRVNLLVVLGLATAAAAVAWRGEAASPAWLPAVGAAVTAWLGSVAWLGEKRRAGLWLCGLAAAWLAAATVIVATGGAAGGGPGPSAWLPAVVSLVSGLVTGLTVHAMLLGHWYLNAPGMRVDALRRMIDLALAAWGLQLVVAVGLWATGAVPAAGLTTSALLALRWLAGLVGLPVLLVMARKTLDIPNTQSATGILYVACLAAILGELTAQLLQVSG
ncbi:MAG: hypothetical protein RLZZ440_2368 [Planctomycetota bacterium]|jgi:hypothetical protein